VSKDRLDKDRIIRLDALGFVWYPLNDRWEKAFNELVKFHKREGHCRVTAKHEQDGKKIGIWVSHQRAIKKNLKPDQIERLNSLGFTWDPLTEQWEQAFTALQKFLKREGHCRVNDSHIEGDISLGSWVGAQREKKARLSPERLSRLNSLGFSWDPITEQWEEAFAALMKFHKREGHCRVPKSLSVDEINLGAWVSTQRQKKIRLSQSRIKRLNALGFTWKT
jgi:DNA-binding TFAR19-related protein (PDSD5 family)